MQLRVLTAGRAHYELPTSADCGARARYELNNQARSVGSLAQPELRLRELWWVGDRHRPKSTPTWRSRGLPNAGEVVVGEIP